MSASVSADDRLTVSGKVDTRITLTDNLSLYDRNYTKLSLGSPANPGQTGDEDALSHALTRFNLMFTIEAFENSKAVLHTIVDKEWGRGGVLFGHGGDYTNSASTAAYGGAAAIEGYWFEGLIPGTAAKFEIGVPYINGDAGDLRIFNTAAPGITLNTPLSGTISNYTWYAWLGNDFDGYGPQKINDGDDSDDVTGNGNDWAAGSRFHIAFMEGLSVDLIYALYMNECSAAATACGDEIGHWVSGKLHYQYGDFSVTPSLTLYLADHDTADSDTESFLLDIRAAYTVGPLSLEGRIAYTPGDSDGQDRSYDVVGGSFGVWGIPQSVKWFSLFGNSAFNDLGPLLFGETIQLNVRHDKFGLMHAATKAAYTLTPQTTLSVALGLFNSAEETSGTPTDFVADGVDYSGGATYAGGSHVATEIDAWLDYQFYSNTTISLWAAYAMTGDALDLMMNNNVYESQDVVGAGARINYSF